MLQKTQQMYDTAAAFSILQFALPFNSTGGCPDNRQQHHARKQVFHSANTMAAAPACRANAVGAVVTLNPAARTGPCDNKLFCSDCGREEVQRALREGMEASG